MEMFTQERDSASLLAGRNDNRREGVFTAMGLEKEDWERLLPTDI